MIEITVGRGDSPEALELVAAMEAGVTEGFGPTTPDRTSIVSASEMVPPSGAFVVLREDGRAVAGGGIRRLEPEVCEIKRMYVVPEARGRGPGRSVLVGARGRRGRARVSAGAAGHGAVDDDGDGPVRVRGLPADPGLQRNSYASFWGEKEL